MNISYKTALLSLFILVFIVGSVVIINNGRPVKDLDTEEATTGDETTEEEGMIEETPKTPTTTPVTTTPAKNVFTTADVAKHATPEDCWAIVGGDVYDLTTWVERHPGGSTVIKSMCGTDGTAMFTKKHGGSSVAKSALGLLKIGSLSN